MMCWEKSGWPCEQQAEGNNEQAASLCAIHAEDLVIAVMQE
jgi:hypothetical protein